MLKNDSTPTDPQKQPTVTLDDLQESFRMFYQSGNERAKKTMQDYWHAGAMLRDIKERLPHGKFRAFLSDEGVATSTAGRLMTLAEKDLTALDGFASVSAVLASIKAERQIPANVPRGTFGNADATPVEVVPVDGDPGGYELPPPAETPAPIDLDDTPPPAEVPDVGEVNETDMLRFRADEAERRRDELATELAELQDRAEVVLARDSDDSRAGDIWAETETATAATERARAELARVQGLLSKALKSEAKAKGRWTALKNELLKDAAGMDTPGRTRDYLKNVLRKHFKVTTSSDAGQE